MSAECLLESLLLFCRHFGSSLAAFLHQQIDWSAKAAPGGAKEGNAKINSPFWTPLLTHFRHIFKTNTTFFISFRGDVLVMLSWCICVPFLTIFPPISCAMWSVPEVIWTAQAWPKHMFWLLSAPRNDKKTEQKSIAIWSYILNGIWHHFGDMFWRRSNFLDQMVVYKIECEKGAPKRWNKDW